MDYIAIDAHTAVYERDLEYALECAKIDEAFKICPTDQTLLGYWEDWDGIMHLVTERNYPQYQHDDRVVWV